MAASTILLAISKQSEKPRKLVGAMLQTFYIIRFRTDPCLVLESAGIFSVWEGFSLTHRSTGSRCLWEPDADPVPGFSLPTFSSQQAEHRGCFAERTLAPSFRVLRCLLAVLSGFSSSDLTCIFVIPLMPKVLKRKKGRYIMVSDSTFLLFSRRSVGGEIVPWRMNVVLIWRLPNSRHRWFIKIWTAGCWPCWVQSPMPKLVCRTKMVRRFEAFRRDRSHSDLLQPIRRVLPCWRVFSGRSQESWTAQGTGLGHWSSNPSLRLVSEGW